MSGNCSQTFKRYKISAPKNKTTQHVKSAIPSHIPSYYVPIILCDDNGCLYTQRHSTTVAICPPKLNVSRRTCAPPMSFFNDLRWDHVKHKLLHRFDQNYSLVYISIHQFLQIFTMLI